MNLSVPLKSVTSGLDAAVLTVLARTATPLTGRRVAALSGGSHTGVQPILERLTRQGLVLAQPGGNSVLYILNRDHLLAGPLLALTESRTAFLQRLRSHLQSWRIAPVHASLFGSLARGDGDENSDIDVLVVRPRPVDIEDAAWNSQLAETEELVHRWTGNALSWFELTEDGLSDAVARQEPVVDSWRSDAVHLAGAPLSQLLREPAR